MKWIKMSEKLPEYGKKVFVRKQDAMWVGLLFKDSDDGFKGNILTLRGALEDVTGERIDHYEWLDESLPASIEDDAERTYKYNVNGDFKSPFSLNEITKIQRSAHITCARQYMGEIEKLRAEIAAIKNLDVTEQYHKLVAENSKMRGALEAEGYCTMCHEKKKKHALLVCDTCYDSFDGDRRSFWDDDFVH